ncbi:unnamed protein product [Didymodactylos carnosus]|uniref:Uncharacterized protein n=1 Tax=Didymodactylos carnosus TaxID=1234261 RepID=A0A815ZZ25_9BILA|nr:unnamed protein product [Didymodactylos carnosus]CAF1590926.1 unnamed protein product [Didymodactylos carnosus]CAF4322750.1 unnamed protein product [Didymodactylos carnosus]CAF4463035.1 unnamed protein product [Didymodactylos carnosus]
MPYLNVRIQAHIRSAFNADQLLLDDKSFSYDDPYRLSSVFTGLGSAFDHKGEFSKALFYYRKSLEIKKNTLTANYAHFASTFNNMGFVYYEQGDYSQAIMYFGKALEIDLPNADARNLKKLANSLPENNIGAIHACRANYDEALDYYKKTMDIQIKTSSINHPSLAIL